MDEIYHAEIGEFDSGETPELRIEGLGSRLGPFRPPLAQWVIAPEGSRFVAHRQRLSTGIRARVRIEYWLEDGAQGS